jgi:hypothetical protein
MAYLSGGNTGGGGGTPGAPAGSIQGNNAGSFAGVPNSSIDFTSGLITQLAITNPARISIINNDDFNSTSLANTWATNVLGGTINVQQTGPLIANHPGQLRCQTTNATDRLTLLTSANANTLFFGNGVAVFETAIYLENLANVTTDYFVITGFADNLNGEVTDGVYFKYNRAVSANWIICAANNSTRTQTVTSKPVAATTYIGLRIVVNAAGTSAEYFVADTGTDTWTSIGTVTTNIPTTNARICSPLFRFERTAGTATIRNIWIDYVYSYVLFTTPRV